jgi:hypothetical protein
MADPVDGTWDGRAKEALADFSRHARVSVPVGAPTRFALHAVQARKERVCPLKCGKGESEQNGACVAKVREKRQPLRASAEDSSGTPTKLCWTQGHRGTLSVGPCVR